MQLKNKSCVMGKMEKVGMIKWVLLETEAPCSTSFAWELWVILRASRKASHTVCLETEFTVCILQAIIYRHFLQQSLETFWPAYSLSYRGRGPGTFGTRCSSAALSGRLADARAPRCSHSHRRKKPLYFLYLPSASTLDYFTILPDQCD